MRSTLLLPFLFLGLSATAQIGRKELRTDSGLVVVHYFKGGGVSTKEWMDKDGRWGRSWAYRKNGEVLFAGQTRRFAGHASVHFSYHLNGAVSKVETSDAPDGGIQWYRSTTTYDDQGNKTGFTEQGHDNDGYIPRPGTQVRRWPEEPEPPKQETVVEQRMFVNEVFVVNPTKSACRVTAIPKHPSPALPGGMWTLAPGDTVRIGAYSMGEAFPPWEEQLTVDVRKVLRNRKRPALKGLLRTDTTQPGPEHRRYYLGVSGWSR